jgi:hypothetical protein
VGGNQAERKGESIGMGDKLIFYIPSDGDTVFDSSLISVCRAVEGFIRDKYEKKKYMDRSLDINVLRVGCKSFKFCLLLIIYFLIRPEKNLKGFHLINKTQMEVAKWSQMAS